MVTNERRFGVVNNDYDPGNYIEGSPLEGRIDWDGLEQMEQHALGLMEEWSERFDRIVCCFSGGIDGLIPVHLAYRLGFDDALGEILNIKTAEEYPSNQEYIEGIAERWNFDIHFWTTDKLGLDYLLDDSEQHIFPHYDEHQWQTDNRQRKGFIKWSEQQDQLDMRVYGRRIQHNAMSISHCDERQGVYQGNPIRNWKWSHVIAYADTHDLPISPGYRHDDPYGIGEPWYHRYRTDASGNQYETLPKCWWTVRDYCIYGGYTDFWKYLKSWFPEGETYAAEYAAENDLALPDIEEGYDHGCDVHSNPRHVGPEAGSEGDPEEFRETQSEVGARIYERLEPHARGDADDS